MRRGVGEPTDEGLEDEDEDEWRNGRGKTLEGQRTRSRVSSTPIAGPELLMGTFTALRIIPFVFGVVLAQAERHRRCRKSSVRNSAVSPNSLDRAASGAAPLALKEVCEGLGCEPRFYHSTHSVDLRRLSPVSSSDYVPWPRAFLECDNFPAR
uniref:Uncharacterized protein n=1 Tax=Mycena chlorophos TaxID=658473 RepID=A0ABQ0LNK3_MYCCL|nr:predicted protein [Mycena chlorophos]